MPIYAYQCAACGHAKDALQKISDPPLTQCPACGKEAFVKQLTAAGFQLKGSGWYATDFKGTSSPASTAPAPAGAEGAASPAAAAAAPSASASASASAAPAACGGGCACH